MSYDYISMNPYELHKILINHYVLNQRGATTLLARDVSKDKRDFDIIRENHKFLWEENEAPSTWEERLAKKYYDKLYKEYCITDLSRYKENKFAMRWQTEQELICGKGQFICGAKNCTSCDKLKTWEVNFGYIEHGKKKYALVKLRLCLDCSAKLNYKSKRKEITRSKLEKSHLPTPKQDARSTALSCTEDANQREINKGKEDSSEVSEQANFWKGLGDTAETVSREDEFEEYLKHLLL